MEKGSCIHCINHSHVHHPPFTLPALWLQHVTFFWNGNRSGYFNEALETYVEVPSDLVPFNELPDMKAREICEAGKEALRSGKFDQVRINFAK